MTYLLCLIGIVGSFYMIYYRQKLGDMIGEAEWMGKVGGIYNVIVLCAIILFFWCLAELTGTTGLLFQPILYLFPGSRGGSGAEF